MKQNAKRVLSLMLCVCLLLSLVPAMALGAAAAGTRTVYFDNSGKNWSTVNVYTWNPSGPCTGEWPGSAMTHVEGSIYSYEVPTDAVNIIFNNGSGTQTSDLTIPTDGSNLWNGSAWSTYGSAEETIVEYYLFGFIDGANYGCEDDYDNMGQYKFVDGKLTTTFETASYVGVKTSGNGAWYMAQSYCTDSTVTLYNTSTGVGEKLYVPGNVEITFTLVENSDDTLTLSYAAAECEHLYSSYVSTQPTCDKEGVRTYTCGYCGDTYDEPVEAFGHSYVNGICTTCGGTDPDYAAPDYYLFGYINGADYGWKDDIDNVGTYKFEDGKLTAVFNQDSYVAVKTGDNKTFYMCNGYPGEVSSVALVDFTDPDAVSANRLYVPGGKTVNFTLSVNAQGSLVLSYTLSAVDCSHADHDINGTCTFCGATVEHTYSLGVCTVCGAQDENYAPYEYYLFGYINGANYGCEEDASNLGTYKFVDGKLTASFSGDSYVAVKEVNPGAKFGPEVVAWYMTDGWQGEVTSVTLYDSNTLLVADKLFVPANTEITFTMVKNEDGTLTLSYTANQCDHNWSFGRCTLCGLVCDHSWNNGTCDTCGSTCGHKWSLGTCQVCGMICAHDSWVNGACTTCQLTCSHNYVDNICTICGLTRVPDAPVFYLVGYINGANYGCEEDADNMGQYKFVDNKLVVTFEQDSYVFLKTEGNQQWYMAKSYGEGPQCIFYPTSTGASEKMYAPGGTELTFTLQEDYSGSYLLRWATPQMSCPHESHNIDGICDACGQQLTHLYINGVCECGAVEPVEQPVEYFLFGYINGANYACEEDYENMGEYKFVDGTLVVTFEQDSYVGVKTTGNADWFMANGDVNDYSVARLYNTNTLGNPGKLKIPGNVPVTLTLTVNWDKTLTLNYTVESSACEHSYNSIITTPESCGKEGLMTYICEFCGDTYTEAIPAKEHVYSWKPTQNPTCTEAGVRTYTCANCGDTYTESVPSMGHSYVDGICTVCGATDGSTGTSDTYYLVGWINGANYGCEEDYENMGSYKFVDGKLTAKFDTDSYVFLKTEGNGKWLLADAYCTDVICTFKVGGSEKLFVPGGMQLVFDLVENEDGTVTVGYTAVSTEPSTAPTIGLKYPTVSFEDMILMNVYYSATDLEDVVEMGLVTYTTKPATPSVDTADQVIPGYAWSESDGFYFSTTAGIAPKDLGDTIHFAVYYKLVDGTYGYTKVAGYSPKTYALGQLNTGTAEMKALVVAMLNYGAAAQTYFGYKTDSLMNATLTSAQKALVADYSADMIATVTQASGSKLGTFVNDNTYTKRYPTITFEGAFCINYYFQPSLAVKGDVTMYIWSLEDFNAASVLTKANATKAVKMELTETGEYLATLDGIAAKDLDKAAYVSFVYSDGTTEHCGGVLGYTIGMYCKSQASKTGTLADLAKACAVYGYYAKQLFN